MLKIFNKTTKNPISSIINLLRLILERAIGLAARFLLNSRFGRNALFSAMQSNQLTIGNTYEGLHYIVNTSDNAIGRSVFRDRTSYDSQHLITSLDLIGKKKSILLDVGANIGTIGILGISKGFFDRCIAFEPDPTNFRLLDANVHLNGIADKFQLRNEALSNEVGGLLNFELSESNYGDHRIQISKSPGKFNEDKRSVITVNVNTLDAAVGDYDPNECMLFMDTQGFEGHVLCGARTLLDARVPIVTEFWPYGLKRSEGLELFYSVLSKANYTTMYDLRYPDQKLKFSIEAIKKIASDLGEDGQYTDLLFLYE